MGRERLEDFEEHGGNLEQTVVEIWTLKILLVRTQKELSGTQRNMQLETRRKEILVL